MTFDMQGEAMRQRQYPTLGRLQYQLKDMKLALDMGAENHVRLPLAAAATALYSRVSQSRSILNDILHQSVVVDALLQTRRQ